MSPLCVELEFQPRLFIPQTKIVELSLVTETCLPHRVSHESVDGCMDEVDQSRSEVLKKEIRQYFSDKNHLSSHTLPEVCFTRPYRLTNPASDDPDVRLKRMVPKQVLKWDLTVFCYVHALKVCLPQKYFYWRKACLSLAIFGLKRKLSQGSERIVVRL